MTEIAKTNPFESKWQDHYPARILEILSEGGTINMACRELRVCKQTIYNYRDSHPEFAHALAAGREWCIGWFDDQGLANLSNPKFNEVLYQMIRRNQTGWTEHRKVALEGFETAKTHEERVQILNNMFAQGKLTGDEAVKFTAAIAQLAKIEEVGELKAKLEQLEQLVKEQ